MQPKQIAAGGGVQRKQSAIFRVPLLPGAAAAKKVFRSARNLFIVIVARDKRYSLIWDVVVRDLGSRLHRRFHHIMS
jgi:hypothetical protein